MAIANQEMIRDNNRRQVLEYLVNHPPVSRAALSQQLHLTKATISNIKAQQAAAAALTPEQLQAIAEAQAQAAQAQQDAAAGN